MTKKEIIIDILKCAFIAKPGGMVAVRDIEATRHKDLYELVYDAIDEVYSETTT